MGSRMRPHPHLVGTANQNARSTPPSQWNVDLVLRRRISGHGIDVVWAPARTDRRLTLTHARAAASRSTGHEIEVSQRPGDGS